MMLVFWKKGFDATSVADLEEATGLNKRSLYNTFGNKQAIFEEVLRTYMGNMGSMVAILMREPQGIANIKAFFSAMSYTDDALGCLLTKTANQKGVVSPSTYEIVRSAILGTEQAFHDNLVDAFGETEARRVAAFLTATVQGITTMSRVDPDPGALERRRRTCLLRARRARYKTYRHITKHYRSFVKIIKKFQWIAACSVRPHAAMDELGLAGDRDARLFERWWRGRVFRRVVQWRDLRQPELRQRARNRGWRHGRQRSVGLCVGLHALGDQRDLRRRHARLQRAKRLRQ